MNSAVLYRVPLLVHARHGIRTPFPRMDDVQGQLMPQPLLEQHRLIVATLKRNRVSRNVDFVSRQTEVNYNISAYGV